MFRHALCVFPYRRTPSSRTSFPPLGLEYVAAALRPYAERIELVNFRHERTPSTQPFLRPETDLVCYSINWPMNLELIRDDINALPPGVTTILGGRTATENPRYWLEACPNVDAVVCGDGEQAIAEIAQRRPWSEIAGLAHRGPDGQLVFNPPRANVPLDDNLMPARDLRRHPYYLTEQGREHGDQDRPDRRLAGLSVQLQVLQLLHQSLGREAVLDAAVARVDRPRDRTDRRRPGPLRRRRVHLQPDRVAEICDLLIAKGIRKHYIVNARLEIADRPDVIRKMEQAGFLALLIGVESTQDATLKSMGKGFTIEQVRERFAVLRKSKMVINAYFIVGNIGETEEQMLSIASFARSIGVDLIHVSRLRNEPYSGLSELVAQTPGYHIDADGSSIATPTRPTTSPTCGSGSTGGSTRPCRWHAWW